MDSLPFLIRDLALLWGLAGVCALVFQRAGQPAVLGYLVAGIALGLRPAAALSLSHPDALQSLSELGVACLMFSLGLEFSFRKLWKVGAPAFMTAAIEVFALNAIGYFCARALGWNQISSLFCGAMLSISSTTIIAKALEDLGLKSRRFAELIFGVLVVEDLLAILLLVAITSIASGGEISVAFLGKSFARLILIIGSWVLTGYFLLPRMLAKVGRLQSRELLLLLSMTLCLGLGIFATSLGYSLALGAFIMGSILSESRESHLIEELILPLKHLFVSLFFVSVGMKLNPLLLIDHYKEILLFSAIVLSGKILATTAAALIAGQPLRRAIQVGFGIAQIGEFSFVIAALGQSSGIFSKEVTPILIATSFLTTITTPFFIRRSHKIAVRIEKAIPTRTLLILTRYSSFFENLRNAANIDPHFRMFLLRWLLNTFILTAGWSALTELMLPRIADSFILSAVTTVVFFIVMSPFLWRLISLLLKSPQEKRHSLALLLVRTSTIFWFSALASAHAPPHIVFASAGIFVLALLLRLKGQWAKAYRWIESSFVDVFQASPKTTKRRDVLRELAPWDEHLVRVKVHADSTMVGKTLQESSLRKEYGVNVVALQRGSRAFAPPAPSLQIFPRDELLLLGDDENIERLKKDLEYSDRRVAPRSVMDGFELRGLTLPNETHFRSQTIRESRFSEDFSALVVGIERGSERIINPDPETILCAGDHLWVVGSDDNLDRMNSKFQIASPEHK